jgi:cytidylate kinase
LTQTKPLVVAIDGYSSTGKSTIAKGLAANLGLIYVDSGAMYRAVTLFAIRNKFIDADGKVAKKELVDALSEIEISFTFNSSTGKSETMLNGENVEAEIRTPAVAAKVSEISAISEVRTFLVRKQKMMGQKGGIVMDGRDIGTVVFPDALVKIFTTATDDIRARRRYDELQSKGDTSSFEEVKANLLHRDRLDESRSDSPLKQAEDAILLDNSELSLEEQLAWAEQLVRERAGL